MKTSPLACVLDQSFEQPAILGGQLAILDADVSQKHDVVFGELVEPAGKLLDVILVAAAGLFSSPG